MKNIKIIVLFALVVGLVAIVFQNQTSWQVRFLWISREIPGVIVLFMTAAAGFIVGSVTTLLVKRGSHSHSGR